MSLFFWDFDSQRVNGPDQGKSERSTNYGVDFSDGPPASKEAESPSTLITLHYRGRGGPVQGQKQRRREPKHLNHTIHILVTPQFLNRQ